MKNYQACCDEVGYDRSWNPPEKQYTYYAYLNGTCTQFSNESEAKKFSRLHERKVTNQDEVDSYFEERTRLAKLVFDLWYSGLREEYSDLSDEMFSLIYGQAYEDGHSSGYDSVYAYFVDIYHFTLEVIKVWEKTNGR